MISKDCQIQKQKKEQKTISLISMAMIKDKMKIRVEYDNLMRMKEECKKIIINLSLHHKPIKCHKRPADK